MRFIYFITWEKAQVLTARLLQAKPLGDYGGEFIKHQRGNARGEIALGDNASTRGQGPAFGIKKKEKEFFKDAC